MNRADREPESKHADAPEPLLPDLRRDQQPVRQRAGEAARDGAAEDHVPAFAGRGGLPVKRFSLLPDLSGKINAGLLMAVLECPVQAGGFLRGKSGGDQLLDLGDAQGLLQDADHQHPDNAGGSGAHVSVAGIFPQQGRPHMHHERILLFVPDALY